MAMPSARATGPSDLSPASGSSQNSVPIAVEPRPNYAEFAEALLIAAGMYSDVELAFWLNAPQPLLEMWTPIQLLARGDGSKLLGVMRAIEEGAYL